MSERRGRKKEKCVEGEGRQGKRMRGKKQKRKEEYNVRSKEETRKRDIVVEPTEFISGSSVVTY